MSAAVGAKVERGGAMPFRIALFAVMAALVLSGCGRRGDLEDPNRADDAALAEAATPGTSDFASPGAVAPDPGRPQDTAPERPFVLDPLI